MHITYGIPIAEVKPGGAHSRKKAQTRARKYTKSTPLILAAATRKPFDHLFDFVGVGVRVHRLAGDGARLLAARPWRGGDRGRPGTPRRQRQEGVASRRRRLRGRGGVRGGRGGGGGGEVEGEAGGVAVARGGGAAGGRCARGGGALLPVPRPGGVLAGGGEVVVLAAAVPEVRRRRSRRRRGGGVGRWRQARQRRRGDEGEFFGGAPDQRQCVPRRVRAAGARTRFHFV